MKNYLEQLFHLSKGKVAKQIGLVYTAQIIQAVLGFLINILLIRHLTIDEYGSFSIFISTFMLVAGLSHWGWTETFIRFGAPYAQGFQFGSVESFFRRKIVKGSGISLLLLSLASPFLANHIYKRADWQPLILIAGFAGFLTCLYSFEMNRVRVLQRFRLYFSGIVTASSLRLSGLITLLLVGSFQLWGVVSVYVFSTLLMIILVWIAAPAYFGYPKKLPDGINETASHYNKWLLLSIFSTTLITNMDLHFVAFFFDGAAVAKLGAVSKLTLPISILVGALATTLLPKLSQSHENQELFRFFLRKLRLILPLIAVIFALAGAAAIPLLSLLAGHKYSGLEMILLLQLTAILIVLLTNPFGLILLAKGQTKPLACMNLTQLVLAIIFNLVLVPRYGVIGSICATIGVNLSGLAVTLLLVKRMGL